MSQMFLPRLIGSLTRQLCQFARYAALVPVPAASGQRCISSITSAALQFNAVYKPQTRILPPLLGQCQQLLWVQPSSGMKTKCVLKKRCKDCFITMSQMFLPRLIGSLTRQLSQFARYAALVPVPAASGQRCISSITSAALQFNAVYKPQTRILPPLLGQCQQLLWVQPSSGMKTKSVLKNRCKDCFIVCQRGRIMRFPNRRLQTAVDGEDSGVSTLFRNPFVHELRFTPLQKLKIAVMTVTLFPFRLLFAAFMMLLAWPFAFMATFGRSDDAVEPLSWWRWLVDLALKAIMRAMWFSGGFHWVRVKGRPALPSEAPILTMAPHSSYFDAIPVTMTMASIVMKMESKDIPLWGTLIKYIRPVFVSRSDQDSRRKTVEEIKRRAASDGEWPQIMIFPEGTCTNRSCLIAFKPGAFIPGVPVQPVVLRYPNELDTISWTWQGPGAFKILWLTLCQLHNFIEIEYLPTYTPSEEEKQDPALFASNVRRIMAKALGLPIIDYSFEDCQLAMAKGPMRLPRRTCLLEFARLLRRLGLKNKMSDEALQEAACAARQQCGSKLNLEAFAQHLNQPPSEAVQDIFSLFEQHGTMDVREYIIALSVVCRPFRYLETLKLAFRMFEAQEDGAVVEDELAIILKTALGVGDLAVSDLFRAIDCQDKGKITFDDFRRFMESCPDFLEQFHCLYESIPEHSSEPTAPSSNGFCADFSPRDPGVPSA
ncbi:hypothetical protein DNTS_016966 [Danionella cerebrum]|nr:hypothetical protein DNTS_016966 [Danionella translucida]